MGPAKEINQLIKKLHLKASADLDKRVHDDITRALVDSKKIKSAVTQPDVWTTRLKTRTVRFAAAAVVALVIIGGMTFWPGRGAEGEKWWFGPPVVWGQEIMAKLDAIKAVTYREQWVHVMPDGSERTSNTWYIIFESSSGYRRDTYYKDVLIETQWYVPDGDGTLRHSVRFDLKSYFTHSDRRDFGNCDPVNEMRSLVGFIGEADKLFGEKTIGGVNCVGFEISGSKIGLNGEKENHRIWFSTETKLPVRIEEHGAASMSVDGHPDEILAAREKERKE